MAVTVQRFTALATGDDGAGASASLVEYRRLQGTLMAAQSRFDLAVTEREVRGATRSLYRAERSIREFLRKMRGEGPVPFGSPGTWPGYLSQLQKEAAGQ